MDKDIEHAEKALACIDKMKEGLSEFVALLDISDDTFGEMDRLETYVSLTNSNEYNRKERTQYLLGLLLFLAKDECRKSLDPIGWAELEAELVRLYIPHADNGDAISRLRQLDADMKDLLRVYDTPTLVCDRNYFLRPILKVSMDCIRLIHYLERRKKK